MAAGQVVDDEYSARDDLIVRWRRDFLAFSHRAVVRTTARRSVRAGGYMWGRELSGDRDGTS